MGADSKFHHPGASEIIDEAFHLLRNAGWKLLPAYYIGSLPFVMGMLYFWADMSRAADARQYLGWSSLGVAALFGWMKCWQALFTIRTREHILGQNSSARPGLRFANLIGVQIAIHASAFFILPVAFVVMLPFGWCLAFYQNVTAAPPDRYNSLTAICRHAWRQAVIWPRQNHLIIAFMVLFSFVVMINIGASVFMLPYLIKKFFGIDTIFTLSGSNVLNSTFWAAVLALTYLCLDPVMKVVYTLRCFYSESLKTGTDIQTELNQCLTQQRSEPSSLA